MGKHRDTQSFDPEPENRAGLPLSGASYRFWSPGVADVVVTVARRNLASP